MPSGFGKSLKKSRSVKLHKKSSLYGGIVLSEPAKRPKPTYGGAPGEVDRWSDGTTKEQWTFEFLTIKEDICDCEEWCAEGTKNADYGTEADDGLRRFYVPTSGNLIVSMVNALKEGGAPLVDGAPEVEIGGTFIIKRTGLDHSKVKGGGKPPVTYSAIYKPATEATLAKIAKYRPQDNGNGASEPDDMSADMEQLKGLIDDEDTKLDLSGMKSISEEE